MSSRKRQVFSAIIMLICVVPMLLMAVHKVSHDQGAETYENVYGLALHWTSFLIIVWCSILAMLIALVGRWWYFWRIRRDSLRV